MPNPQVPQGMQPLQPPVQQSQPPIQPSDNLEEEDTGHGPIYYILVAILAIALVAAIVAGAFMIFGQQQDTLTRAGLTPVKTAHEMSGIQDKLDELTRNSMLSVSINKQITFTQSSDQARANIQNNEDCPYDIQVTITRKNSEEQIYQSGLISPGESIEYIQLDSPLSAGTYDCSATFGAFERKTGTQLGSTVIGIKVVVE